MDGLRLKPQLRTARRWRIAGATGIGAVIVVVLLEQVFIYFVEDINSPDYNWQQLF